MLKNFRGDTRDALRGGRGRGGEGRERRREGREDECSV
jgi:hypothetical protein